MPITVSTPRPGHQLPLLALTTCSSLFRLRIAMLREKWIFYENMTFDSHRVAFKCDEPRLALRIFSARLFRDNGVTAGKVPPLSISAKAEGYSPFLPWYVSPLFLGFNDAIVEVATTIPVFALQLSVWVNDLSQDVHTSWHPLRNGRRKKTVHQLAIKCREKDMIRIQVNHFDFDPIVRGVRTKYFTIHPSS